jgi:hypothetical protein
MSRSSADRAFRFLSPLILVVLLACTGGDDASRRDHALDHCLAAAGFDGPLGDVDNRRQQEPAFETALTRCYQEIGVRLPAPGELTRRLDRIVLAEVRCLRGKGWDVPDPVRGADGALNLGDLDDYVPHARLRAFTDDDDACLREVVGRD